MEYTSIEQIKNAISSADIRVVSFDVFDTLLVRMSNEVEGLFRLLNKRFRELSDANLDFGKLRMDAEGPLRRAIISGERKEEDITLFEIYDQIRRDYKIPRETCEAMMREELEIEHRICRQRKSGKELFDHAIASGKRVIVNSDMYLLKEHIESLIRSAGYEGYERIFVSSECGLRKKTGHLFPYVAQQLSVRPEEILHIGDNPEYDIEMGKRSGFRTAWLPSAREAYLKYGCAHQAEKMCRGLVDWEKAKSEPGVSLARQMAAIRYFDDPFRLFDEDSDYNCDPAFLGYAALGPHVLATARWIADQLSRDRAKKIVFLARDGYLPMQVYKLMRTYYPELPEAEYLHTSRLALLPVSVVEPADLFQIPMDKGYHTPETLLKRLSFCAADNALALMQEKGTYRNYKEGEKFTNASFHGFMSDFIACAYDEEKHAAAKKRVEEYLIGGDDPRITEGCAIFDSGYSGRIASAIRTVLGKELFVYYMHRNEESSFLNEARGDFKIRTLLDFSPYMESTMREYAYLEVAPSCVGYSEDQSPLFDAGPSEGYADTANKLQQGAIEFTRDYLETFHDYVHETDCRALSAVLPFEAFLRFCSPADRHMFDGVMIDDELWGGRRDIDLNYLMDARLSKLPKYAE